MNKWLDVEVEPPFDKHYWTKRSLAFKNIIFPSCARRIILQKKYGYGHMVAPTMNGMLKTLKPFVKKLIRNNEYKAYYIVLIAFYEFLGLIEYPYPEETLPILLENGGANGK